MREQKKETPLELSLGNEVHDLKYRNANLIIEQGIREKTITKLTSQIELLEIEANEHRKDRSSPKEDGVQE
jgi:hypothetical protein